VTTIEETVLAVHENPDGYWYIGAGRTIAEGPYRRPEQLLDVASDLLSSSPKWRIEVFDVAGDKIVTYSSDDTAVEALRPLRGRGQWAAVADAARRH
jgi:hypothetical protein